MSKSTPKPNLTHQIHIEGFSKLTFKERISFLIQNGLISEDAAALLTMEASLSNDLAGHFIENSIGSFPIPLGIAVNFNIDKREYVIPMATEETSIIASASKTAKWIRQSGEITTTTLSKLAIGQIQLPKVKDHHHIQKVITDNKRKLMNIANNGLAKSMVDRGGGVQDIVIRTLAREDGFHMVIIHVLIDTCDAMGANIINKICEFLKSPIETMTNEKVGLCILSNFTDDKITEARIVIRNIARELGKAIEEASLFAELDPYRAATNNKGILNAVDSILLATGNDWRAVEAGMHAYAARSGNYTSLSRWRMQGSDMHGVLAAPISVGIVGGVTNLHPVAKISLNILGVQSATELARIIAAAGLVQNLGALNALVSGGIVQGHMRLHVSNMAIAAGATKEEVALISKHVENQKANQKYLSNNDIKIILSKLRSQKKSVIELQTNNIEGLEE